MHILISGKIGLDCDIAQAVSRWLSGRSLGFVLKAGQLGFVVDKMALERIFLRVLQFSRVSIIPPLLHIRSCIIWGTDSGPVRGRSSTETTVSAHRN
jgi:hypothetical protein